MIFLLCLFYTLQAVNSVIEWFLLLTLKMKQLDDYVEQIDIGLTKDVLDELGWLSDTTR